MKEFDLNAALEGQPVITRDGRKVTELHHFKSYDGDYPVYAVINNAVLSYTKEGKYNKSCGHPLDLCMAPKVIEKWMNIYEEEGILWMSVGHDSEAEAKAKIICGISAKYIKTIKVTNEK